MSRSLYVDVECVAGGLMKEGEGVLGVIRWGGGCEEGRT